MATLILNKHTFCCFGLGATFTRACINNAHKFVENEICKTCSANEITDFYAKNIQIPTNFDSFNPWLRAEREARSEVLS